MNFISTKDPSIKADFRKAATIGLAPGGGLFVPEAIPKLEVAFLKYLKDYSLQELAFHVLSPYIKGSMADDQLQIIIRQAFSYEIPIRSLPHSGIRILELYHGPTWAFKDVGARFLAGCLAAWQQEGEETIILVATSGDTGGAVAHGFYKQKGLQVVILYPKGKVTPIQEQQITGLNDNIKALAVEGSFDDCQSLVKMAFNDQTLRDQIQLTSANSINIARWLPQMVFYVWAWKLLHGRQDNINITLCVPSGNYGNISAAFLSQAMGFWFGSIEAAHNANDTIPRYLLEGTYSPHPVVHTLANAMDVSDPSNFPRLQYIFRQEAIAAKKFKAEVVSDDEILAAIRDAWQNHQYLLDPHTATAWHVLNKNNAEGLIAATAHPFKFEKVITDALGYYPEEWRKSWPGERSTSKSIPVDYKMLRDLLLNHKHKGPIT